MKGLTNIINIYDLLEANFKFQDFDFLNNNKKNYISFVCLTMKTLLIISLNFI